MRRLLIVILIAILIAGCSGGEKASPEGADQGPAGGTPAAATASAAPATEAFEDPEPPDAQAKAEAVVGADFNKDKTTQLKMSITTIVGRTSELEGIGVGLAAREEKIDDRLTRLAAKVTDTEVVIQLPGSILFDFDSANIRPDAARALGDVSAVIRAYAGRPVRIEGHTDSIASDDYNLSLSQRRAKSVVAWLTSNGVEAGRLTAVGSGETKPVATNDTAAGRQQNRRVEVVIAKK